eukprot:CAMPEP_0176408824 /NCGR_PEP_ID=MMETSP0127-20121128/2168_1 /TAXON_ID=938130 /ORGANISM="Platyophrya macrostoma, Strain WH" /LENGTH=220 /DNA_ID=CAMNT_0017788157 /DNA_START=276 /DNA_END=938 /DNA_ORIENTATION=-
MILYLAVLYKIKTNPANLLLIIGVSVFGGVFGLGALKFYKFLIVISTALCGAYITIRSLSLVTGNFPNEFELAQQIQLGNLAFAVQWQFYLYMNAIFLLAILGGWMQFKIKRRRERKKHEAETYFAVEDKEESKPAKKEEKTSNWNRFKKKKEEKEKEVEKEKSDNEAKKDEKKKDDKKKNKAQELIEKLNKKNNKNKDSENEAELKNKKGKKKKGDESD